MNPIWDWNIKFINNIKSNGIECWYTVQKLRDAFRLYKIVPQYPADSDGVILDSEIPEYYILFEGSAKPCEKRRDAFGTANYGEYKENSNPTLIRVFTTLQAAFDRAELQYEHIKAIGNAYFPEDNGRLSS